MNLIERSVILGGEKSIHKVYVCIFLFSKENKCSIFPLWHFMSLFCSRSVDNVRSCVEHFKLFGCILQIATLTSMIFSRMLGWSAYQQNSRKHSSCLILPNFSQLCWTHQRMANSVVGGGDGGRGR